MKASVVVISFGLVVVAKTILGSLRANYLKQASESVSIDASKEIVLRYAIWYYIYPLLGIAGSGLMAWGGCHSPFPRAVQIYEIISVICLLGGLWLLYRQWTARVKNFEGKLIYTEGDRWEIAANEVDRVTLNGFTFIVRKRSEKVVRVPATFEHSEIILAFLKQAAVNK